MKGGGAERALWFSHHWPLSAKLCLGLGLVAILGLGLGALTLERAIRPAFAQLEERAVAEQIGRAETFLQGTQATVRNSALDYAVWDDSYAYVAAPNASFEQENLSVLGLVNLDVNAIVYARFDGQLLGAIYVDLGREEAHPASAAALGALVTAPRFRQLVQRQASFSEYLSMDGAIYAVAAAQIFTSDGAGTPEGYIVMARALTEASVSEALHTPTRITRAGDETTMTAELWRVVVPIRNADGSEIAALQYQIDRDISKLGSVSIASALGASAVVMVGVLLAMLLLLRIVVVRRLEKVTHHVQRVASEGVLTALEADPSGDELGSLNRSFNAMIVQLHELRERFKEQAFLLGQSDLAASVIHNVRNSLNPVSVIIAQTLAEKPPLEQQDIVRALNELESADTPVERRARLAAFLLDGLGEWERRAATRRAALLAAKSAMGEALEILRSQQKTANREIPLEVFDPLDLIKRHAAMARFDMCEDVAIDIPQSGVEVLSNPLLLSQVIGNLMTNALESIRAGAVRPGHLSITLTKVVSAEDDAVMIVVADNGAGFEPAEASKLFERGHSSKARSSGLGLHWCANTLRAMGGSLVLESDGVGKGARAVVTIPCAQMVEAQTRESFIAA